MIQHKWITMNAEISFRSNFETFSGFPWEKAASELCEYNFKCKWNFEWTLLFVELKLKKQHHHHHHHLYIRVWSKKESKTEKTLTKNLWNKINRIPPAWYIQCWDFRLGCFSSHSCSVPNIIYRRKKLLFGPSPSRFVPFHVSAILWEWKRFSVAMCNDWSLRHNRKSSQNRHTHTHTSHSPSQGKATFFHSIEENSTTYQRKKQTWVRMKRRTAEKANT